MKTKLLCCLLAATVLFAGCKKFKGEYTIPAYLHLDKMHVVDNSVSLSSEAGFFSSQIDGVQLELWFDGADTTTRLGTFQLPCTVPVLCDKPIKKSTSIPL